MSDAKPVVPDLAPAAGTSPVDGAGVEPSSPAAESAEVQTESIAIEGNLKIEVYILTLDALRQIASEIARRVAGLGKTADGRNRRVVLGGESLISALRAYLGFRARAGQLKAEINSILRPSLELESLTSGLDAATAVAQSLANLLSFFKAETTYTSQSVDLDEKALYPALAGQLISRGVSVSIPEYFPIMPNERDASAESVMATLGDLRQLREKLSALPPADAEKLGSPVPTSRCFCRPRYWVPAAVIAHGNMSSPRSSPGIRFHTAAERRSAI
jgi:hypothetical protein